MDHLEHNVSKLTDLSTPKRVQTISRMDIARKREKSCQHEWFITHDLRRKRRGIHFQVEIRQIDWYPPWRTPLLSSAVSTPQKLINMLIASPISPSTPTPMTANTVSTPFPPNDITTFPTMRITYCHSDLNQLVFISLLQNVVLLVACSKVTYTLLVLSDWDVCVDRLLHCLQCKE